MADDNPYTPDKSQREEILEDLRRVGAEHGPRLTRQEYNELGEYSNASVRNHVGRFTDALREAGLFPTQNITEDDAIRAVRRLGEELGEPPTGDQMDAQGVYTNQTVSEYVGSWEEALLEAGFSERAVADRRKQVDSEELLAELRSLAEKLGHPPRQSDIDDYSPYHHATYNRRFGSLTEARERAGLQRRKDPDHPVRIDAEQLREAIRELADGIGRPPTREELEELGRYSMSTYYDRFESLAEAYRLAGVAPPISLTEAPADPDRLDFLTELLEVQQTLGRVPTREDVEATSVYSSGQYAEEFGSVEAAIDAVDAGN